MRSFYFSGKLPVKQEPAPVSSDGMAAPNCARKNGRMARPRKSTTHEITHVPHAWAFLPMWRDLSGLTQENVAATFDVSSVTIHRWETGKAPVSGEAYLKLARLYGAPTPGHLMFPPGASGEAEALKEAHSILQRLSPSKLRQWLELGQTLASPASEPEAILPKK
jgi:transcriptional regulator with XRE-family HTH domain